MRWLMRLLHLGRPTPNPAPVIPPEAHAARLRVERDWSAVHAVRARSDRLYSENGFIDALSRAQERGR